MGDKVFYSCESGRRLLRRRGGFYESFCGLTKANLFADFGRKFDPTQVPHLYIVIIVKTEDDMGVSIWQMKDLNFS